MIEAKTNAERLDAYQGAYRTAKGQMEANWHPAWQQFHTFYTRRRDGAPLTPVSDLSTAVPGAATQHQLDDNQTLAVNHIQSILRTIVASTLNKNPTFSLDSMTQGFEAPARAKLGAIALNSVWSKEGFNRPIRDAYVDSLQYGRGWIRLGWQSTMTREVVGDTAAAVMADAIAAVGEVSRRGARLGHKPFTPEEVAKHRETFAGALLIEDKPTIRRVSPFDMFFDPLAQDPADARWIAQRWRCPLAAARTNKQWEKQHRLALSMTGIDGTTFDPEVVDNMGDTGEYQGSDVVWIVDFFDLGDGTWCQFAEGGEGFLRKPAPIPYPFGQPFCWIDNIDDTGNGQPISEVEVIWPHQQDLTNLASELGLDRVQSRGKVMVRREDAEQMRPVLESSDRGLVIPVDIPPGEATMDAAYKEIKFSSNAQSLVGQIQLVSSWMTQASGVSDYLRGGATVGETATGVNAMQMAAANYMGEKASRVRDFITEAAQRVFMMMQVYSRLEYFATTKAPDENNEGLVRDATVAFGREHIMGSFRVIVSADSTETKTPEAKRARAQAIAATAIPFVQSGVVDPGRLFNYVMKEGFDMDDPTILLTQQAYNPAPAPQDPTQGQGGQNLIGGISMTPGTEAGQLGATAARERFNQ